MTKPQRPVSLKAWPSTFAGVETVIAKAMAVRLGFNTGNFAGPKVTAGLGWTYRRFSLDYAFVPYGELGASNRVSVTMRWGDKKR